MNWSVAKVTVDNWYFFTREVFVAHSTVIHISDVLGGPGCTVEIDEMKFGK